MLWFVEQGKHSARKPPKLIILQICKTNQNMQCSIHVSCKVEPNWPNIYHTMPCNTMHNNIIRCSAAISCNSMSYHMIQNNTIQFGWHNINWTNKISRSTHGRWHGMRCRADLWRRHTALQQSSLAKDCCMAAGVVIPWNIVLYNAIPWDTKRYRNIQCNTLIYKPVWNWHMLLNLHIPSSMMNMTIKFVETSSLSIVAYHCRKTGHAHIFYMPSSTMKMTIESVKTSSSYIYIVISHSQKTWQSPYENGTCSYDP